MAAKEPWRRAPRALKVRLATRAEDRGPRAARGLGGARKQPRAPPPSRGARPPDPGVRVATPTRLLGLAQEDSLALPLAALARPTPKIYLLIFWAKARRSAMAAEEAAAAVWARTGGRVPPRSRSLPRGLCQSQLRTRETGAGGRSRERALP